MVRTGEDTKSPTTTQANKETLYETPKVFSFGRFCFERTFALPLDFSPFVCYDKENEKTMTKTVAWREL